MSTESTPKNGDSPDISLAKKQLASDLKILVAVQVVALGVAGLGLFLIGSDVIPNNPDWDAIHSLCGVLGLSGMVTVMVVAVWGAVLLTNITIVPIRVQIYSLGVFGFPFFVLFISIFGSPRYLPHIPIVLILSCIFPFYSIVGQFFIARWLKKEGVAVILGSVFAQNPKIIPAFRLHHRP